MTETKILLLCENDQASSVDRRALRDAGFQSVKSLHSGIDAAKLLAGLKVAENGFYPDLVVCFQRLEDMDGEQFCAIVRRHPLLTRYPVLLILPNETEAARLEALGCEASAILGRPFSADKLKNTIASLARGSAQPPRAEGIDTQAFDDALASYGILLRPSREPEDYFRFGAGRLKEGRWNEAIDAFQRAVAGEDVRAEAEMGLAAAYKGKGDAARFREWLTKGAETLVRAGRWDAARAACARLLKYCPGAKNPFLGVAHQLSRERNYAGAARTLAEGLETMRPARPEDKIAALCAAAEDSDALLLAIDSAFAGRGDGPRDLTERIRAGVQVLAREKKERERQMAIERKWLLARQLAEKNRAAQAEESRGAEKVQEPTESRREPSPDIEVAPLGEEEPEIGDFVGAQDDSEAGEDDFLAPLADDFSDKKSGVSDILSVIKLTWKLARRQKKD